MWTCPVCVSCSWLSSLCRPTWNCISDSCKSKKFIIINPSHINEDQSFSSDSKFISKYFYLDTAFLEYHKYSSPSFDQLLLLFFISILVFCLQIFLWLLSFLGNYYHSYECVFLEKKTLKILQNDAWLIQKKGTKYNRFCIVYNTCDV